MGYIVARQIWHALDRHKTEAFFLDNIFCRQVASALVSKPFPGKNQIIVIDRFGIFFKPGNEPIGSLGLFLQDEFCPSDNLQLIYMLNIYAKLLAPLHGIK